MTVLVSDAFGRTNAASWQNADTGGAWTCSAATGIVYATTGSTATRTNTSGSRVQTIVRVGASGVGNHEVRFKLKGSALSVSGTTALVFMKREDTAFTAYSGIGCMFTIASSSFNDSASFHSYSGGTGGSLSGGAFSGGAGTANQDYWCAVQIQGINPVYLRSKLWKVGDPEPAWFNYQSLISRYNTSESSDQCDAVNIVLESNSGCTITIDDVSSVTIDTTILEVQNGTSVGTPVDLTAKPPKFNSVLYLSVARNDGTTIATPSGWTQIGATTVSGARALALFTKVADTTETSAGLTGAYSNAFAEYALVGPTILGTASAAEVTNTSYGQTVPVPVGTGEILLIAAEVADTASTGVTPAAGVTELAEIQNAGSTTPLHWVGMKLVESPTTSEAISATGPNAPHRGHAFAFGKVLPSSVQFVGSYL